MEEYVLHNKDIGFPYAENPLVMPEKDLPRGPSGRKLCRCGCGREAAKNRRVFASDKCEEAYRNAVSWNFLVDAIIKLRGEICEICGINIKEFRHDYWKLYYALDKKDLACLERCLKHEGWPVLYKGDHSMSWANIHHIIHRANGGNNHPLNLQVLCVPCHKEVHKQGNDNV